MKIGHFEDLGVDIMIILKRMLSLMSRCGFDPCGLREVCMAGCFEHDNGLRHLSGAPNFFTTSGSIAFPKKDSAQWRWLYFGFLSAKTVHNYFCYSPFTVDRDSAVSIATCYGLDGPGIEYQWGRYFPHLSSPALGPIHPPIELVPGLSPGVKRPGRGVYYKPPSSAEVKERVEIYLYSTSGPSWPVTG